MGRISGPILKDNLLRDGVDLAFETDLVYLDVTNKRIGIRTAGPTRDLTVSGKTRTTYLIADTDAKIANIILGQNSYISTVVGKLYFSGTNIYVPTLDTDDLRFNNNTISSLIADSDIEIRPTGSGILDVYANTTIHGTLNSKQNITLSGDFSLYGNLTFGNQTSDNIIFDGELVDDLKPDLDDQRSLGVETPSSKAWQNAYVNDVFVGDFELTNNQISTVTTNTSMLLSGNGTGGVLTQQLLFNNNIISATSNNSSIVFKTDSYGNVLIDSNTALKIPVGTNSDRTSLIQGDLRFTTTETRFRGWGTSNITFGGVFSDDRKTYVIPETSLNADDKTINFVINDVSAVTMTSSITNVVRPSGLQIDDIRFKTSTISTTANNSNITFSPSSGNTNIDNITFNSGDIINQDPTSDFIMSNTGQLGYTVFEGTVGMDFPSGNTTERPATPEKGLVRFNTDLGYLELWSGTVWQPAIGPQTSITSEEAEVIMDVWTLILG